MVDMGAPEEDIDGYIAGEGTDIDAVRTFKVNAEPPQSDLPLPVRALVGLGAGLTQRGVGVIQAGADLVGAKGVSEAAGRVKKNIDYDVSTLGTTGEVARVVGDVAPTLAIPGGAAAKLTERIALGGISGAAEGFTRAAEHSNLKGRSKDAAIGLATGAVAVPVVEKAGQAVQVTVRAGKDIAKGVVARSPEQWQEVAGAMKAKSQETYAAMRDAGAVISPKSVNSIVADLEAAVSKTGKTNADLHKNTLSVISDLKKLKNKPLSLEEADQYRQLLNDVVSTGTDGTGKINPDAMKALSVIDALDSRIERLGASDIASGAVDAAPLLKQARQEWGKFRRFDKVQSMIEKYGDTPGVLKNQVRLLLLNKKATRGFSEPELDALRKLAKKGGVEGWLRLAGRAGIDLKNPAGNVVPLLTAGAVGLAGDAATGGLVTAGATGARYASQALTRGQADRTLSSLAGLAKPTAEKAFTAPRGVAGIASSMVPTQQEAPEKPRVQVHSTISDQPDANPSPVPDHVVDRIIGIESGGRADAKNPNSSALGAGQFIKSTWLGLMKDEPEAAGKSPLEVLALRKDPSVSRRMVAKYAERNAGVLANKGVQASPATIYLSHFLDGPVAAKLAKADPNTPVLKLVGMAAVKANPSILKGKKAGEVLAWAQRKTNA